MKHQDALFPRPAGKAIAWPEYTQVAAEFSDFSGDMPPLYRWALQAIWGPGPRVMWLMMNPSTADTAAADPTLLRCLNFSKSFGPELGGPFDGMNIGNVHGWRSPDQEELGRALDPIGTENLPALRRMAADSALIVAAYGTPKVPRLRENGPLTLALLHREFPWLPIVALRVSADGHPCHPLYLPRDIRPARFEPLREGA